MGARLGLETREIGTAIQKPTVAQLVKTYWCPVASGISLLGPQRTAMAPSSVR
jgi:hypothetical protein